MTTTARALIESVVRSVCGHPIEALVPLTGGGLNEVYRVDWHGSESIVVRIARRSEPWFTNEEPAMNLARRAGVPSPEVLGVEHHEHGGELLSFSLLRLVPGRALSDLASELPAAELERLVVDCGELLARVHSVAPCGGMRHELVSAPDEVIDRAIRAAEQLLGAPAAGVVERGAERLRDGATKRPGPGLALAHGDWLPKHFLIDDGAIVGVIDWEFAGEASPARDFGRWQIAAGDVLHDRSDWLRRGYGRIADPALATDEWLPAFAIDCAVEVLGWKNPASPARIRRCIDVIDRHLTH